MVYYNGKVYYDSELPDGKYLENNWRDNTVTVKTFDNIIEEFYSDLKVEISDCLEDCILDRVNDYYFKLVWED